MKILHLISQHPESTGSGFYLRNVIRQANAAGHANALIAGLSPAMRPRLEGVAPQHCRFVTFGSGKLDFAIPGMSDIMPYPSTRFSALSPEQLNHYLEAFADVIEEAVDSFSPDLIHSHHLWLATSVARRRCPDLPLVTSCHSTDLRQLELCPHLAERVVEPCRDVDRVLALGKDQKRRIQQLFEIEGQRIDVVGGGFAEDVFTLEAKPTGPPIRVLYAGKLSLAKGVDCLLKAFAPLVGIDLHLHLAGSGSGEEEQRCLELAEGCGTGVTVHGRLNQTELAELMGRCHLFVLPSFYEGLPLVLLEALAAGCRIITTDLPGCKELLDGADSDLVEFVRLPELERIDRPAVADLPFIEGRLREAILRMVKRIRSAPSPPPAAIKAITAPFGWREVFTRISRSYQMAIRG